MFVEFVSMSEEQSDLDKLAEVVPFRVTRSIARANKVSDSSEGSVDSDGDGSSSASDSNADSTENMANITAEQVMAQLSQKLANLQQNDLRRLIGMKYFAGSEAKRHSSGCELVQDAHKFLQDIESRTVGDSWDNEGRIDVAIHFSLDAPRDWAMQCKEDAGGNWKKFSADFLTAFPKHNDVESLMGAISEAKREVGETLSDYFIRLNCLTRDCVKIDQDSKNYAEAGARQAFLRALPKKFASSLSGDARTNFGQMLQCAVAYVNSRPELNLNNEAIYKERGNARKSVNAVAKEKSQKSEPKSGAEGGSINLIKGGKTTATSGAGAKSTSGKRRPFDPCRFCKKTNHSEDWCYSNPDNPRSRPAQLSKKCYNCGGDHLQRDCLQLQLRDGQRRGTCFNCQGRGHHYRECPSPDLREGYEGQRAGQYTYKQALMANTSNNATGSSKN